MKKKTHGIFPSPKSLGKRQWGSEILLVLIPKILTLKLLKIKKGKQGGLQYHHKKNECGYLISGKLQITYQNEKSKLVKKILTKGKTFHFQPGLIHQEKALSDCQIIEASSPHFNDRVRVEKKFGFKMKVGLPSTKKNDIKFL
tara:strand:+ start:23 stop:451 length:429 start_codon:yes stop_codon:yes gene_type:complete